jgi:hypothetical protein
MAHIPGTRPAVGQLVAGQLSDHQQAEASGGDRGDGGAPSPGQTLDTSA